MKKRGIALAMSGLMVVSLLSACGKTNSTSTDSKNKGEATNKTITVSVQTGVGVQESWEAVAKAYEQKHSDVKIDIDLKAQEGYDQWVQTTFKTENPKADIVNINLAGNTKNGKSINYKDYIDNDSPYSDGTWGQQFDVSQQRIDGANGSFDALSLESVQVLWMYNQDIFDKVGVQPPKTWDELIDVCNKISAAGYQPIAVAGNYDSFYSGQMGWLSQIYADQTTRSMVEKNRAQKGDFDFNVDVDGKWKLDLNDPWNDDPGKVSQNPVRAFANVKNGIYRGDTDAMKAVWTNFSKVFPKFAGEDSFFGTDTNGAKTLFYQGKAAMTVDGGWGIVTFMKDMKALESGTEIKNTNGEAIQNVKNLGSKADVPLKKLGELTDEMAKILSENSESKGEKVDKIGKIMTKANTELKNLNITIKKTDLFVKTAIENGASGAKISGGGLGGCVIALAENLEIMEKVKDGFTKCGAENIWVEKI